jgi:hypothetical protein
MRWHSGKKKQKMEFKAFVVAFILGILTAFIVLQGYSQLPEAYYTCEHNSNLTYGHLEETILNMTMPHEYVAHVFDCSEGAAYLEWYLENKGFCTDIATKGDHAYVIVRLKRESYAINTAPIHFYHPNYYNYIYLEPDKVFEDIYEACECSWYGEWNWWTVVEK